MSKKNTELAWTDYDSITQDVPRQWFDVQHLAQSDEQAIMASLPSAPATIIEFGAHNRNFSKKLIEKGYDVHTYDIDSQADVDVHDWKKLPAKVDAIIAKQVMEHIPASEIEKIFARFREKTSNVIFTIPNYWAPSYVFLNDYTHVNNQSLRTWVYWLRRAGFSNVTFARLGNAKRVPLINWINHFLGGNDPCHSLIIRATTPKV